MFKPLKEIAFRSLSGLRDWKNSPWRTARLLILCYHGVSIDDEHLWNPQLYISPATLRRRMGILRDQGYAVLPLAEALSLLRQGALEKPSVAITFDDGPHDFYTNALPILQEHGFPATVYLTTYYAYKNLPVFDPMVSYLLWKARRSGIDLQEFTGQSAGFNLEKSGAVDAAADYLRKFATDKGLSGEAKHDLLARIAEAGGVDFNAILKRRILHIMSPDEVTSAARAGIDVQLHTHRHRAPADRELFSAEIEENRRLIHDLTGNLPQHFCYPSGVFQPHFFPWLRELSVCSATTCLAGLATRQTDPMLLPRFCDTSCATDSEFEGWLSGVKSLLASSRAAIRGSPE